MARPLQRQAKLRSARTSSSRSGCGITATQFMGLILFLGCAFISVNLYVIMPQAGLDAPLPRAGSPVTDEPPPLVQPTKKGDGVEYHVLVSTGCSPKQNFQAYIFYYHALKSQQPGTIWRIAACKDDEKDALLAHHKEFIEPMSPNFKLYISPDFSTVKDGLEYHYFNKPFSTHHWLEHALGYNPQQKNIGDNPHDDAIVILCDPDQIIMRPFTNNKFDPETELWAESVFPLQDRVIHGRPMGQMYGFVDQWATKTNITRYVPKQELPSPVQTMSKQQLLNHYTVGPPYLATAHDFYIIATAWKNFVPLVHDDYPHLLAEMFAYCLAAAHYNLPHQVATSFMLSDVGTFGLEGWDMIEPYSKKDVCTPGSIPNNRLPHILHYCQRYTLGKFVIGKHRIPDTFLSCSDPLLMEPPTDLGEKFNFALVPDTEPDTFLHVGAIAVKHHAFMLCTLIPLLNEAAIYWKDHHCQGETVVNKEKTLTYFKNMEVDPKLFALAPPQ